jgi:tetraacyldisaccharide 4'-kinase
MVENILQKIWYNKNVFFTLLSILLLPFSFLYFLIFYIKQTLTIENEFSTPIICFGNINIGGTGKTSTLLSLLPELIKVKPKLVILLRGYKGTIKSTHKVDPNHDTTLTVGDEALLYANSFKTFISSNRSKAIKEIIKSENPDLIILDDGFQDKRIKKNKNIILINGNRGLGNGLLLPTGPLREIPSLALKKTDIIILIGEDCTDFKSRYQNQINKKDLFTGKIVSLENGLNKNFLAFSGIGNNESFFNTLEKNSYNLVKKLSFPDHYQYKNKEIEGIISTAKQNSLIPITTEKDINRISTLLQNQIKYLKIKIEIDNKDDLINKILEF